MPKSVPPLVLKDSDAIILKSIITGQAVAGDDIIKRAKVLQLLSEGKQIKVVAKEIGMRENSVTEIRRRFLANGINSLMDKDRTGRPATKMPAEEVEIKVRDIISSAYASGTPIPSVKEIARDLNASDKTVRAVLKKKGLIQERRNMWIFPTCDGPEAKAVDLIGIYLSPDQQLVFVRILNPEACISSNESVVTTKSSTLADTLSASISDDGFIELTHALDIFVSGSDTRPTGKSDALTFVKALYADFHTDNDPCAEYHLFVSGKPLAENGRSLLTGIHVHAEPDSKTWLLQIKNLFSMLCATESDTCQRLSSGINAYLQCASVDKAVFEWKKGKSLPGTDGSSGKDTNAKAGKAKPAGTIEFEARIMADDGHWITYTANGISTVKQEDFDMTSANSYLNSFDSIEQAIVAVSRDAARGVNEAYAADLVKKTNSRKKRLPE